MCLKGREQRYSYLVTIILKKYILSFVSFFFSLFEGLIVLNVRWRNKVYSGALIDVEKTKWASER